MSTFGNRISGFFGTSAGGTPTPITNTLQTVVDTAPQGLANKGFYVINPSNSGNYCGNIDNLVDSIKLIRVANNNIDFISDYGVDNNQGQLKKESGGSTGMPDRLLINATEIRYTDIVTGFSNTIQNGTQGGNTIYLQPSLGNQYWLVQQPPITIVDFDGGGGVPTPYVLDTTDQTNFLIKGVSKGTYDIVLGANIINRSITRFAIYPITDPSGFLQFKNAVGFNVIGLQNFDSTTNYVNGGLVSVIRVDSTFIMSTFS